MKKKQPLVPYLTFKCFFFYLKVLHIALCLLEVCIQAMSYLGNCILVLDILYSIYFYIVYYYTMFSSIHL